MLDIGLLRKAVEWAEVEAAKPDKTQCEWYQHEWKQSGHKIDRECGTCYCIAGHIVAMVDGPEAVFGGEEIGQRAAELLGVPLDDVFTTYGLYGLFGASNSIEAVRWHAEELARKYGEEL